MNEYISPETLANGNVLNYLKMQFINECSKENLFPLLSCLKDSIVFVPMNTIVSEADREQFMHSKIGDIITSKNDIRLKPDILKTPEGKLFFPIFSQQEQIPEDYARKYSTMSMDILRCLNMAHTTVGVEGIVMDAFTSPLALPFNIADLIKEIPSALSPKKAK